MTGVAVVPIDGWMSGQLMVPGSNGVPRFVCHC